jgi:5-methylcytosine-specific restriction endonuclease McrA
MKLCSHEGCGNPVFSKGYCRYHYPKKSIRRVSDKQKIKKLEKRELLEEDLQFYAGIWDKREHCCYECGVGICEPTSANFHHILEKRNYPDLRHIENNIVILCVSCHQQVETMIEKCPRTKELTMLMKDKYA